MKSIAESPAEREGVGLPICHLPSATGWGTVYVGGGDGGG